MRLQGTLGYMCLLDLWFSQCACPVVGLLGHMGFPGGSDSKESACNAEDLGGEDPLEKGMATHSSVLAWRIPGQRSLAGYSPRG